MLISDEMVEAFRKVPRRNDCNCDACERDNTRVALAAVLTEPRVLRMAESVVERHQFGPALMVSGVKLTDLADRLESEAARG